MDGRYHSLDALRASMMLLGLVLHAGASYTAMPLGEAWPYHDRSRAVAFDLLLFFIHLFRMPVFFVVAGFFGALLYERDGLRGFLRNRLRRVGAPLVIFWATALPLAGLGFIFAAWRAGVEALPLLTKEPPWRQQLLGHLWFLYDLLIFYVAASAAARFVPRIPMVRDLVTRRWGVLGLALVTWLTLLPMRVPGLETSASILPPVRILVAYGVFFTFGWLLYRERDTLGVLAARSTGFFVAGLLTSLAYLVVVQLPKQLSPWTYQALSVAAGALAVWLLIFGIVGMFVRRLDARRSAVRYMSDASYWIYLVHLVPITWTAGLLAPFSLPAGVKFALVLAATVVSTTVTYHYFVRATVVGVLLNGRRAGRA